MPTENSAHIPYSLTKEISENVDKSRPTQRQVYDSHEDTGHYFA